MAETALSTSALRKEFGSVTAVEALDLTIARGDIFGLVGPDAAGKTTTFRMLCGILPPTSGSATVLGVDVLRRPESVKPRIGYMSQRFSLYGDLTVLENLAFFADIYHVPRRERAARREELLGFSRLGPFQQRLAQDLSGGMKQKLALACTLMHTPELLFLDEPTTGVDPVSRRDFWRILYQLSHQGVTLIVSTPYMDEAERCTCVGLMHRGRLIQTDTPEGLKRRMTGDLLELICTPQRGCRELLLEMPGVKSVQAFGERLHVWLENADRDQPLVEEAMIHGNIVTEHLRRIPPTLEDVFVSVIENQPEGAA